MAGTSPDDPTKDRITCTVPALQSGTQAGVELSFVANQPGEQPICTNCGLTNVRSAPPVVKPAETAVTRPAETAVRRPGKPPRRRSEKR